MSRLGFWPSIPIAASPKAVFAYLSDLSKHHEWHGGPHLRPDPDGTPPARFHMNLVQRERIPGFGGWYGSYGGPSSVPRLRVITVTLARAVDESELVIHYEPWDKDRIFRIEANGSHTRLFLFIPWYRLWARDEREILRCIKARFEDRQAQGFPIACPPQ